MSINLKAPELRELKPRIMVCGVGGAGGNAVNNMIQSHLEGVEFIVANTDAQAMAQSRTDRRIQLGANVTQGLGAGARPDIGRAAAEETLDQLETSLEGAHMCFIAAGMGGGTGTGAAPVVARAAREKGILTVGVVTKPFTFEGNKRMQSCDTGMTNLKDHADTLIVIPNDRLLQIMDKRASLSDSFKIADEVLRQGIQGISELITVPGLINLDFADVRTVMIQKGKAMMGTGEAEGEERALRAAEAAISNPLLESGSMQGARGLLINISGGEDLTLMEVEQAASRIGKEVDADADILFGSAIDPSLEGRIRVSIVATGLESEEAMEQNSPPLFVVEGGRAVQMAPAPMQQPRVERAPISVVQQAAAPNQQTESLLTPEAAPQSKPMMKRPR